MSAANYNITLGRGEDYSFGLTIQVAEDPIDLTGDSFKAQVRRFAGRVLTATFTVSLTDAVNGLILVSLPQSETLKLQEGQHYQWDLFRIEGGTSVTTRLLYGDVRVSDNITLLP